MYFKPFLFATLAGCVTMNAGAQTATTSSKPADTYRGFSIGLNSGTCWNTKPFNGYTTDKPGKIGGAAALGLYYRFNKHWEAGLAAEYKRLSIGTEGDFMFEDQFDPLTGQPTGTGPTDMKYTSYYPTLTPKAVVNYHFAIKKIDAYGGISAGYTVISSTLQRSTELWSGKYTTGAFSPGVHLGANYPLSRHLSLNAQLGADGIFLLNEKNRFDMLTTSFLVGVRFHF